VRETEVSIGKAPRLGFHTPKFKRDFQNVMPSDNVITFSESKYNADPELNSSFILQPQRGIVRVGRQHTLILLQPFKVTCVLGFGITTVITAGW